MVNVQYTGEPFMVLAPPKRVIHRGVLNGTHRRILWYCTYGSPEENIKLNGYEPLWHPGGLVIHPDEDETSRFHL